ncbi:hypothetical protein AURDEDRAFT_156538 [Auricularia subglabra TFB-10046 SS5]|nr:hypothetical protein AURDEDRAFT_156538 [Auricularia subglabra TFB-10046 SS5]
MRSRTHRVEGSATLKELDTLGDALAKSSLKTADSSDPSQPPPAPPLFFGRTADTQAVVDIIASTPTGYAVVLGGPGMGKTTLALSALHDPRAVARFGPRRYFVSCEVADSQRDCLQLVAGSLGIASPESGQIKRQLVSLLGNSASLIMLDNFESVWESSGRRPDAEAALQFLSGIDGLYIIITLRGSERPQGVPWTRPFLPPLTPLSDAASGQLFASISGLSDPPAYLLKTMLGLLENTPLALVLMAILAQYDPLDVLLDRLKAEKTRMLTRPSGTHATRLTSLDVSIGLSLASSRMQSVPDALGLLGLLALIPRGAPAVDIPLWFPNFEKPLSVLLQTALATRSSQGRIHVLAPIRAFVLVHHPPPEDTVRPLCAHYFELVEQLDAAKNVHWTPTIIATAAPELENVTALVNHALASGHDANVRGALRAVVCICSFHDAMGLGTVELVPNALTVARSDTRFHNLAAEILFHQAFLVWNTSMPGDPTALFAEARALYESTGDRKGTIKAKLHLSSTLGSDAAVAELRGLRKEAEAIGALRLAGRCDFEVAQISLGIGKLGDANAALETAMVALRAEEPLDVIFYGHVLCQKSAVESRLGLDPHRQHALLEEALRVYQEYGLYSCVADADQRIGSELLDRGDAEGAVRHLRSASMFYRTSSYWEGSLCHCRLAEACLALDDGTGAVEAIEVSAQSCDDVTGDRALLLRAMTFNAQSMHALWRGDIVEATVAVAVADATLRELWSMLDNAGASIPQDHVLDLQARIMYTRGRIALEDGDPEASSRYLIASAVVHNSLACAPDALVVLGVLAEAVDDDMAELLLQAVMLPALRLDARPILARALLHSATIASQRGKPLTARHRAKYALRHFEDMKNVHGCTKARRFLGALEEHE